MLFFSYLYDFVFPYSYWLWLKVYPPVFRRACPQSVGRVYPTSFWRACPLFVGWVYPLFVGWACGFIRCLFGGTADRYHNFLYGVGFSLYWSLCCELSQDYSEIHRYWIGELWSYIRDKKARLICFWWKTASLLLFSSQKRVSHLYLVIVLFFK